MIVRNVLVETRVFHHVADCNGSYDQNHILFDCTNNLLVANCDGITECVCADINSNYYCDPDCTGTLDCAGICDGPNRLDSCGVCDSNPPITVYKTATAYSVDQRP